MDKYQKGFIDGADAGATTADEVWAIKLDQFKQELVKSLEEEYIPHPQMQDQIDFNYGIDKAIEIIKNK